VTWATCHGQCRYTASRNGQAGLVGQELSVVHSYVINFHEPSEIQLKQPLVQGEKENINLWGNVLREILRPNRLQAYLLKAAIQKPSGHRPKVGPAFDFLSLQESFDIFGKSY
jgi:hypothetical protein